MSIWAGTIVVFIWGIVALLRRKRWAAPLVVTGAAAVSFQILTLAQPPVFLGGVLLAVLASILFRVPSHRRHRRAGAGA